MVDRHRQARTHVRMTDIPTQQMINRQINALTDREIVKQRKRQTDGLADRQTDRQTNKETDGERINLTNRRTDGRTDRQTDMYIATSQTLGWATLAVAPVKGGET